MPACRYYRWKRVAGCWSRACVCACTDAPECKRDSASDFGTAHLCRRLFSTGCQCAKCLHFNSSSSATHTRARARTDNATTRMHSHCSPRLHHPQDPILSCMCDSLPAHSHRAARTTTRGWTSTHVNPFCSQVSKKKKKPVCVRLHPCVWVCLFCPVPPSLLSSRLTRLFSGFSALLHSEHRSPKILAPVNIPRSCMRLHFHSQIIRPAKNKKRRSSLPFPAAVPCASLLTFLDASAFE